MSWGLLLSVAQVFWVVLIATFILLERRSPTATLAWITVVAALPFVGVAIYLLVGPRHLQRKKLRLRLARDHSVRAKGKAAWRDTHVRMVGPAVHGLQATFIDNWVFATETISGG